MNTPCPDERALGAYLSKSLAGPAQEALETHLTRCPPCLEVVCRAAEGLAALSGPAHKEPSFRARFWIAAAAGLFVILGGTVAYVNSRAPSRPEDAAPRRAAAELEAWALEEGQTDAISLPDGTLLKLSERARARLEPPQSGERARLRLDQGTAELWVPPGQKGLLRILGPAAEVRVLGTHLYVKSVRVADAPCQCVEVYEGRVELRAGNQVVPLRAGQRGIAAGSRPYCQNLSSDWRAVQADLARVLSQEPAGGGIPAERRDDILLLAATLRGARWGREGETSAAADPEARGVLEEAVSRLGGKEGAADGIR